MFFQLTAGCSVMWNVNDLPAKSTDEEEAAISGLTSLSRGHEQKTTLLFKKKFSLQASSKVVTRNLLTKRCIADDNMFFLHKSVDLVCVL